MVREGDSTYIRFMSAVGGEDPRIFEGWSGSPDDLTLFSRKGYISLLRPVFPRGTRFGV